MLIFVIFVLFQQTENNEFLEMHNKDNLNVNLVNEVNEDLGNNLTLTNIFANSKKSIVKIEAQKKYSFGEPVRMGSGFIFDKKGHIIVAEHLIDESDKIFVTFLNGYSYYGEMVGKDPITDIAVIRINVDEKELHPLVLGNSSEIKVGQNIAVIGSPYGLSGSMTTGIISQVERFVNLNPPFGMPDLIQTDAFIAKGSSGGPVLNMNGEVIGVNTAIQTTSGEFVGIGYAIPSNLVNVVTKNLIEHGTNDLPWIGIAGRDINLNIARELNLTEVRGFQVVIVTENGPADIAGLQGTSKTIEIDGAIYPIGGDIILSLDGNEIRSINDILIYIQRSKNVGDEIILEVLRDDNIINLVVTLGSYKDANTVE